MQRSYGFYPAVLYSPAQTPTARPASTSTRIQAHAATARSACTRPRPTRRRAPRARPGSIKRTALARIAPPVRQARSQTRAHLLVQPPALRAEQASTRRHRPMQRTPRALCARLDLEPAAAGLLQDTALMAQSHATRAGACLTGGAGTARCITFSWSEISQNATSARGGNMQTARGRSFAKRHLQDR